MAYKYRHKKGPKIDFKMIVFLLSIAILIVLLYSLGKREPVEVPTPYCGDSVCQSTESCSTCPADCKIQCPKTEEPTITFKGELVIAARDVQYKLTGGYTVTGLNLTIKSIQIHETETNDTDENITAEGWITIFNGTKTFDLIDYSEDVIALLGEKELDPGRYTQIRLYISEADVKIYNINVDIYNKTYDAKVPSKVLKLIHPFTIEENKTLILTLDFDVVESFCDGPVCRQRGEWVFRPTLKTDVGPFHDGILEERLEKGQRPEKAVEIPEE